MSADEQKESVVGSVAAAQTTVLNAENGSEMASLRLESNQSAGIAGTNHYDHDLFDADADASSAPILPPQLIRFHTPAALIQVPNPYSVKPASTNNSVAISIAADSDELPPLLPSSGSRRDRLMSHTISVAPVSGRQSWRTTPREILFLVAQYLDGVSLARFCGVDNLCNSIGHEKKLWSVLITKAWNFRVDHQKPLFRSIMARPPQREKLMTAVANAKIGSFQEKTNNPRRVYERNFNFALQYLAGLKKAFLQKKATSKQKNRAYCFHFFFDVMEAPIIMGLFAAFVALVVYELKTRNQNLLEVVNTNPVDGSISIDTVNLSPESPLSLLPFIPLFVMEGYALLSALFHAIMSQFVHFQMDSSGFLPNDYMDDSESFLGWLVKGTIKTIQTVSEDRSFEYVDSQRRCVRYLFFAMSVTSLILFIGSFALFTVFLALKCAGYIDSWSWFSVFAPFYCFCVLLLLGNQKMLAFIQTNDETWLFWGLVWMGTGAPLLAFTCLLASKLDGNHIPLLQVFIPFWIVDAMMLLSCCYLTPLVFMSWDEDDDGSWEWGRCLIPLGYLVFVTAFVLWKTFLVLLVDYNHTKYTVVLSCIPFFILLGVAFIIACGWSTTVFLDNKSSWRGDYVRDEWLVDINNDAILL